MTLAAAPVDSIEAVSEAARPAMSISIIRIKPGFFDAFMALQTAHLERIRGAVPGVRGGRLFKAAEQDTVVFVSAFETAEAAARFRQDPRFQDHLARVGTMIESNEPLSVELAYELGVI